MHLMVGATHHFGVFQIIDLGGGTQIMGWVALILSFFSFGFANGSHDMNDLDWVIARPEQL